MVSFPGKQFGSVYLCITFAFNDFTQLKHWVGPNFSNFVLRSTKGNLNDLKLKISFQSPFHLL